MDFSETYKKEHTPLTKNVPFDEETEKENKGKEKSEEQEKYYSRVNYLITSQYQLSASDKFICFNTRLNIHPYQDDDIQPPKAV